MKKLDTASESELINSLKTLYNQGYELLTSGKYENISKSLSFFLDALPISEKLYNNQNSPNTANILYCIGCAYHKLPGMDSDLKALDFHHRALEMRQSYYGDVANIAIANSLNVLGDIYRTLSDNANKLKGLEFANKALEMWQKLYQGQIHHEIIESLFLVANIHSSLGSDEDLSKGLNISEEALSMARSLYGNQPHLTTAKILNSLGVICEKLDDLDNLNKALACFQESLAIRQKLTSNIDSGIAMTLNNIGTLHHKLSQIDVENKQKHLEDELEYTQKAVEINQTLYGDFPSQELGRSMQDLSAIYARNGGVSNMKQAYQLQEQALKVYQKLYAADHPDIIECLNNLNRIVNQNSLESYDDITLEDDKPESQSPSPQIKDNDDLASQDVNKDSTNLMGNINLEKDII